MLARYQKAEKKSILEFWVKEEGKGCATQVLEELGGIRLSLVQKKSGRKVEMVVEEMDIKHA